MARLVESEVGFSGQAMEKQQKLAHLVSTITNPLFVALPLFLLVALRTAPDVWHALLWWAIIAVGITFAPFLFVRRGVRQGKYSDAHVSVRSQRFIPLLFGLGCMIAVFVLLLLLHASVALLATVTAALIALLVALVITQFAKYKISLHMVGAAGAVTTCCVLIAPAFLLLSPLVALIGWARWKVHAHTPLQALTGTALAVIVTVVVMRLFGLV